MLPQSHISYTIAAVDLLQRRIPALRNVDYRLVALAATGPDLIDKPLAALYFYRRFKSAVLFAHTLIVHLTLFGYVLWRRPAWWPYALAFNGHAILDRLWLFRYTWYWPFTGWRFHQWQKQGSEQEDIKLAYWYAFTRRPELWGWEVGGLIAAAWFVWRHQLYRPDHLIHFISTGHFLRE
jgi:hypothetical protein